MLSIQERLTKFSVYGSRALMLASGLIAAGIAAMIILTPGVFYQSYGIDVSSDVSLRSELRAPAGMLLLTGFVMMAGAFRTEFTVPSLATAATVYLSYGLSRFVGIAIDGIPHDGLVNAAVIEVAIGAICLIDLLRYRKSSGARYTPGQKSWQRIARRDSA